MADKRNLKPKYGIWETIIKKALLSLDRPRVTMLFSFARKVN